MGKEDGFRAQRSVIIPEFIKNTFENEPISKMLHVTDIGYYPDAKFHQRRRENGSNQHILIYCVKGEGWFSIDGERTVVKSDQLFIIPKDTPHSYGSGDLEPWSIYWIHFSGTLASHFYDSENMVRTISPSKVSRIKDRIQLFDEIIDNLEMGYSKENVQYANICLLHFMASLKYINQYRQVSKIRDMDVVERMIHFMKDNLDKRLSLEDIADEAGLSVSYFSTLFKKRTDRSPIDFIIQLRVQKASQYLDNTDLNVGEIALKVGYSDPFNFSRIFKRVMGVSPLNYRKTLKG